MLRFWKKCGFVPTYMRQTANDLTGEHSSIMLRLVHHQVLLLVLFGFFGEIKYGNGYNTGMSAHRGGGGGGFECVLCEYPLKKIIHFGLYLSHLKMYNELAE